MSATCPKCRTIIETSDTAFTLQQQLTAEREAREKAEADRDAAMEQYLESQKAWRAAEQRNREAMEQEPVGYIDKDGYKWRSDTTMDKERWGMRPLYTAPIPLPGMNEPAAWMHSCNVLCKDGVELWIDSCPHCGKPRNNPIPPADVAELQRQLDFVLNNSAFIVTSKADSGGDAYQLWTQTEDEDFIVLHDSDSFFKTKRDAVDAAMRAVKEVS